jgi:hypothetical protein
MGIVGLNCDLADEQVATMYLTLPLPETLVTPLANSLRGE